MRTKTEQQRRTTMVPVTTMEEIPVLTDEERAALLVELKEAEDQIATGQYVEFEPQAFEDRLLKIYREGQR